MDNLAGNWGAIALRGLAAIVFGIIALLFPPAVIAALVMLFGAYAFVDGVLHLVSAFRATMQGERWGMLAIAGAAGVMAGLYVFFQPGVGALWLMVIVALWALVTGVAEIAAAVRLRKLIAHEWLLGLSGVLSVGFGIAVYLLPVLAAVVLATWLGAFAVIYGLLTLAAALRLRAWHHRSHTGEPETEGLTVRHA